MSEIEFYFTKLNIHHSPRFFFDAVKSSYIGNQNKLLSPILLNSILEDQIENQINQVIKKTNGMDMYPCLFNSTPYGS
jgi:hypothetical protein